MGEFTIGERHARPKNSVDTQYLRLVSYILRAGKDKKDRTGTGTKSTFGVQLAFNMQDGFPLLTSKKMHVKSILVELLWFLGKHMEDPKYASLGRTNIRYLIDNDCNIWNGDAYKHYVTSMNDGDIQKNCYWMTCNPDRSFEVYTMEQFVHAVKTDETFAWHWGDLGPVYGEQWRDWDGIDQIGNLIKMLKDDPDSRRLIVNAWNVGELRDMVLPPCHYAFQCYTEELTHEERLAIHAQDVEVTGAQSLTDKLDELGIPKRRLSLLWNQRSVDVGLGLPYNIASYGFLLHMLCEIVNMVPGELIGHLGDTHIYNNHIEGLTKQLSAETASLPTLAIKVRERHLITDFEVTDFILTDYKPAAAIKLPLSN